MQLNGLSYLHDIKDQGCMSANLVPRAMPVRGLGWHWLWGNGQPEPLNIANSGYFSSGSGSQNSGSGSGKKFLMKFHI
jgi:hypothetical protein